MEDIKFLVLIVSCLVVLVIATDVFAITLRAMLGKVDDEEREHAD